MEVKKFGTILATNLAYRAISILSFCTSSNFCKNLADEAVLLAIQVVSGSSPINAKSERQQIAYRQLIRSNTLVVGSPCAKINPGLRDKKMNLN